MQRNKNQIMFQTFNDGICSIYEQQNTSTPGNKPKMQLRRIAERVPYETRKVGIRRFYDAKQENVEIERLIRIPAPFCVSTQNICILGGVQYGIYQVQDVLDSIPRSKDLALKRLEEKYEVGEAEGLAADSDG